MHLPPPRCAPLVTLIHCEIARDGDEHIRRTDAKHGISSQAFTTLGTGALDFVIYHALRAERLDCSKLTIMALARCSAASAI
jgi:hypothetical protein